METLAPKERVGRQKIPHLVPAEIEDESAPVLVRALARVFVLVKAGAVKLRQRPVISREMRGHPVHQHPDAALVQRVDEELKILRRSVTARRTEESRYLVP